MAPNKVESQLNDIFISLWQAKLYQHVNLPGIVVCGDQSSGKSSVLEAISSLKFPTNDGMCTRFATRVEMAYAKTPSMTIQIDTDANRSTEECNELRKWAASIKETDFTRFGDIVNSVGRKLGVDRQGGFLKDALIVQAHGPKLPFFTFIDLPGLIHAPRDDQDVSDIDHIAQLVKVYLLNPRMIILAIVSAKSDLEIQGILKLVLEHDPKGERTIGVITKPDFCEESPAIEKQAIKLLKRDGPSKYNFTLGWHVVKNLKQKESHFPRSKRDEQERIFLSQGLWEDIKAEQKGAGSLVIRLTQVLRKKFIDIMPKLTKDIQNQIKVWKEELSKLKSASTGITDVWKDFDKRLEELNDEMIRQANYRQKDDFIYEVEDLAKEFREVIYLHGHAFEFDVEVLKKPPQTVHSQDGFAEWTVGEKRTLEELHQIAIEITIGAYIGAGQLTEAMYFELYRQQAVWPQFLSQYIEKIQEVLEDRLLTACHSIWPPAVSRGVGDFLKHHIVGAFGQLLSARAAEVTTLPVPNGAETKGAMERAWEAEVHKMMDRRIHEVLKVDVRARATPKKDFATVSAKAKQEPFSSISVIARQAIAVMQEMYLDHIEVVRVAWGPSQIIEEMEKFFRTFPATLKSKIICDEVTEIYGTTSKENPRIPDLEERIATYEGCLARLKDFAKSSERY